jgi:hypothetical protein
MPVGHVVDRIDADARVDAGVAVDRGQRRQRRQMPPGRSAADRDRSRGRAGLGQSAPSPPDGRPYGIDLLLDDDAGGEWIADREHHPAGERERVVEVARLALRVTVGPPTAVHVHEHGRLGRARRRRHQIERATRSVLDAVLLEPARRRDQPRTCASTATTRSTGTRGATRRSPRPASATSPSCCRSATRRATGAT